MSLENLSFDIRDHRVLVTCANPECRQLASIGAAGGLNPEHIAKRYRALGWDFDIERADKNFCPACVKAKREAANQNKPEEDDVPLHKLIEGNPIQTHITVSIEPSRRHEGFQALVVDVPKHFAPTSARLRRHMERGLSLVFDRPQGGVPAQVLLHTKRWEFEQSSCYFQMAKSVQPRRIDATMYERAVLVEALPDDFLPVPLRKEKPRLVIADRAPPPPTAPALKAWEPPPVPAGMEAVTLGMSLVKSNQNLALQVSLPSNRVEITSRYLMAQENSEGMTIMPSPNGKKLAKSATSLHVVSLVLAPSKAWFTFPTTAFKRVLVPAHFDPRTKIFHIPRLPPMLLKGGVEETAPQLSLPAPSPTQAAPVSLAAVPIEARARARRLIEQFFRESDGFYTNGYTDRRIADEATVPVEIVAQIRDLMFGPLNPKFARMAEINDQIAALQAELALLKSGNGSSQRPH